jgi:hypothetical protein
MHINPPIIALLVVFIVAFATPSHGQRFGEGETIASNGFVRLALDVQRNRLFAQTESETFLVFDRVPEGSSIEKVVHEERPAARFVDGHGIVHIIWLRDDSPFVHIMHMPGNTSESTSVVNAVPALDAALMPARAAAMFGVLACDGLTTGDEDRSSYMFMTIGNPKTQAGVVAGWLTHDRGSGIVHTNPERGKLRLRAACEYGRLQLRPAEHVRGETLLVGFFLDVREGLDQYARAMTDHYDVRLPDIPNGYCTWYSDPHGGAASAEAMTELAQFTERELVPYGFDTIQIDDKWQGAPRRGETWGPAADFTRHDPDGPYPNGMKPTADAIVSASQRAGLWLLPFAWEPTSETMRDRQDWYTRTVSGDIYYVMWAGWCLDMTHPAARDFVRSVIHTITTDWGYKYLKLDGLWSGMAVKILYPTPDYRPDGIGDAVFHDPRMTNVEAYRAGLHAVRQGAGPDVYLLGCNIAQNMRTLGGSVGLLDGMRIGRDISARWDHVVPCAEMGSRLAFLHGRVWHNDPDCLMLREPLTIEQARAWASWITVSGQLNMVSEWLPGLPDDRLEILRRTLPNSGQTGRPIDLLENDPARVWHVRKQIGDSTINVIGVFNWDDTTPVDVSIDIEDLGLPVGSYISHQAIEYWSGETTGMLSETLDVSLPPSSCKVFAISPRTYRPTLLGTNRHICQGITDVKSTKWNGRARSLSGTSHVVADDPYELRFIVPDGSWTPVMATIELGDRWLHASIREKDGVLRVGFTPHVTGEARWRIRFE